MQFGIRIKQIREIRKISQGFLAQQVGLTQATISRIESGIPEATASLLDMARVLKVDPFWLQTGEGSPDSAPEWLVSNFLRHRISPSDLSTVIDRLDRNDELGRPFLNDLLRIMESPSSCLEPSPADLCEPAVIEDPAQDASQPTFESFRLQLRDLIAKYRAKIDACDTDLERLRTQNRALSNSVDSCDAKRREVLLSDIRRVSAQRQIYLETEADVQLIADEFGC